MSGRRILVVDDESALREGVGYALSRAGYAVDTASSGEEGLARAGGCTYDLAILDVMLPGLSGSDVCRRLRSSSDLPIIMLTARDAEADIIEGLESGADDYVVKPFSARELVSRVNSLLRRRDLDARAAADSQAYSIGELRIDLISHLAWWAGTPLPLTQSEFRILTFLADEDGGAVSRDQIMRKLWNSDHVGAERVCDVHVHGIRRKIRDAGGDARILQTVRGEGYALRPSRPHE